MNVNPEDFFDDEFPDEESGGLYLRLRADPRTPMAIASLQKLGFTDRYIRLVFRLVSLIPRDWTNEKEAPHIAANRRRKLADKLWKLVPEIEDNPDLAALWFGTNTIVSGSASHSYDGLVTLADCLKAAASLLDVIEQANTERSDDNKTIAKAPPLKRYAIVRIFDLLAIDGRRAPNKEVAQLVSLALDEEVTANDVTQARKGVRRRNYRDE